MINRRNGVAWSEDEYGNETRLMDCKKEECKSCDNKKSCTSRIKMLISGNK